MTAFTDTSVKSQILVVDDSPGDLGLMRQILRDGGYSVHSTLQAEKALAFVEAQKPDLILLDLHMAGMDGYEFCERLRNQEFTRDIPIIIVSGANQVLDKVKAFSKGAVDYILKPYQAEEVLARINTHLCLRGLQKHLEARVQEQTADLTRAITSLRKEIEARIQAEETLRRHRENLEELVGERTAQLLEAKQLADIANAAKSAFLTNMSHELRTPLNSILGYSRILQRRNFMTEEHRQTGLKTIQHSGEHLLALVNDILDFSRIEAGKIELYPKQLHVANFLALLADIVQVKTDERSLEFIFDTGPGVPAVVLVDEKRLRQVLLNLLGNAAKFTDAGRVILRLRNASSDAAVARLCFSVEDTGIGISPMHLGILFQPFEQVGEVSRKCGGAGLVLAISQRLVQLMGGSIQVESELDKGSRFWFEIDTPIVETKVQLPEASPPAGYAGSLKGVLVVDDLSTHRTMLRNLLGPLGFDVVEASNGREGLEKARQANPDLILLDVRMPEMNGIEATRGIRSSPGLEQVPIIIVSASVSEFDKKECLEAGANDFIDKPIDDAHLLERIGTYLGLMWIGQ